MYRYKKELLNNMIDTANSLQRSGLKNEKVIFDLTLSQYPEPVEGFREYERNWKLKDVRREDITLILSSHWLMFCFRQPLLTVSLPYQCVSEKMKKTKL